MTENENNFDYEPSGPEIEKSDHYDVTFCSDKNCGIHLFSRRVDGTIICETILSAEQTLNLIEYCKKHLYQKATRRV
jgi:hypothetical protein